MARLVLSVAAVALCTLSAQRASAQYVAFYQPTTVFMAPTPVNYSVASPVATPAPSLVAAPAVSPAPLVAVTAFPVAPRVVYMPTPQVVTRFRPILGGTVSRVRTVFTPVMY